MGGLVFVASEIALLLVLAGGIGFLAGRYLWRAGQQPVIAPAEDDPASSTSEGQMPAKERPTEAPAPSADLAEVRKELAQLERDKAVEMGRLETGALAAVERTIASAEARVDGIRADLRVAEDRIRELTAREDHLLAVERQLTAALAERDARLAALYGQDLGSGD